MLLRKEIFMITISLSELKTQPGKYVDIAVEEEPVYITKRGRTVAKIVSTVPDLMSLIGSLPPDADLEEAREERLREKMQ